MVTDADIIFWRRCVCGGTWRQSISGKNEMEGTVILYGCPGEEGGAAKAFMARDGLWKSWMQHLPGIRKMSMR